jgi:hypothetical protein
MFDILKSNSAFKIALQMQRQVGARCAFLSRFAAGILGAILTADARVKKRTCTPAFNTIYLV